MKPDIIIHVGTEKTGSTSIQTFLIESYHDLIKKGVLFPKSIGIPSHIYLTACALSGQNIHPIRKLLQIQNKEKFDEFVIDTKKKLKKEIDQASPKLLILSDEHINVHLSKTDQLHTFKNICEEFGVIKSVIIYFRRQDEFRLSMFSEAAKIGYLTNFNLEDPLVIFNELPYRFNYLKILDNLTTVFGPNLIVPKIYNRKLFPDGDVCLDFLYQIGINLNKKTSTKLNKNTSVDMRIIKRLAIVTSILRGIGNQWSERQKKLFVANCEKIFNGPGPIMHKEKHRLFMDQFSEQNDIIKKRYFFSNSIKELFERRITEPTMTGNCYPQSTISWPKFFFRYISSYILKKIKVFY